MRNHPIPVGRPIDWLMLRAAVEERIGRPVSVAGEPASDTEDGFVVVLDPDTGEDIDITPKVLAEAVAAHKVTPTPGPPLTDAEITALRSMLAGR
jgi:hypothetical protein